MSTDLLASLEAAARKSMTVAELFEQRVSHVFGIVNANSSITREQIRDQLKRAKGVP